jgi:hypothetical protein
MSIPGVTRSLIAVILVVVTDCGRATHRMPNVEGILSGLEAPRGVVVGPAGGLFVTELFGSAIRSHCIKWYRLALRGKLGFFQLSRLGLGWQSDRKGGQSNACEIPGLRVP